MNPESPTVFGSLLSFLRFTWKRLRGTMPLMLSTEAEYILTSMHKEKEEKWIDERSQLLSNMAQKEDAIELLQKDYAVLNEQYNLVLRRLEEMEEKLNSKEELMKDQINAQAKIIVMYETHVEKYAAINSRSKEMGL